MGSAASSKKTMLETSEGGRVGKVRPVSDDDDHHDAISETCDNGHVAFAKKKKPVKETPLSEKAEKAPKHEKEANAPQGEKEANAPQGEKEANAPKDEKAASDDDEAKAPKAE